MDTRLSPYILTLAGLSLLVLVAGLLILRFLIPGAVLPEFPWMVLFYASVTLAYHLYMLRVMKRAIRKFTIRFMAATGLKMLFYMIMAGLYLLLFPAQPVPFLLTFFILYLLYTTFEVTVLVYLIRRNSPK